MSDQDLKDFLRKHAQNLDSFLELTPAKTMFGEDVSDQWKRKKQTPEQKKAARLAKLNPANWKTARDVYDQRSAEAAKKRKRELEDATEVKQHPKKKPKDEKNDFEPQTTSTEMIGERSRDAVENRNLVKRAKKRAAKKQKNQLKREQFEPTESQNAETESTLKKDSLPPRNKHEKTAAEEEVSNNTSSKPNSKPKTPKAKDPPQSDRPIQKPIREREKQQEVESDAEWSDVEDNKASNSNHKLEDPEPETDSDEGSASDHSTATSSEGVPDILSPLHDSASSSASSIIPPPITQAAILQAQKNIPTGDSSETQTSAKPIQSESERQAARERLQQQISQFRSQRKADDKPARSRAELLEQRRRKEQERKTAKKEQRKKEKEDEAKRQDEEMAKRFSPGGSGSLLGSPRSPMIDDVGESAFNFGRIAFEDGTHFDPTTGSALATKKHKGASDPASALKAAQSKQARIAGLDDQKRQDIAEKDMWLNARKRAHGERVKDDTSLLKKALKRQEKQKGRSEKEWDKRIEGVRSSQDARQKKRTENIQKRKDEKSAKKSGKKKVKRPGFEGSFRGRTSKGKKA